MNIETTLTIAVEEVQQQAERLQMDRETYDSGKVLEELVHAYIDGRLAETEWQKTKEELECERDEALEKQAEAEALLTEARTLVREFAKLWEGHRKLRAAAYDTFCETHEQLTSEVGEMFSDVTGRLDELVHTLDQE